MNTASPPPGVSSKRAANIQDVAAALGLHKSTVSLGLSGKGHISPNTRARIVAVAREMGYEPNPLAQRLAKQEANNTVCLFAGTLDVGMMTQKILLMQQALAARGLEAPMYTVPAGERQAELQVKQVRQLCRQQPLALLCAVNAVCDDVFPELERFQSDGGTIVTFDVPAPLGCDQVVFDREYNAYQAAHYLIEHGHRHIGMALFSPRREDGRLQQTQNARLIGFYRALEESGLSSRPEWIFEGSNYEAGGADLAAHFLALQERPTALCIVNDYMALAFMVELMRAGLELPRDLSIVGLDNQPVAGYCPVPLTSAPQPKENIVHAVVKLFEDRVRNPGAEPRTVIVRGEIMERQSVMEFPQ